MKKRSHLAVLLLPLLFRYHTSVCSSQVREHDPACVQLAPRIFSQQQKQILCAIDSRAQEEPDSYVDEDILTHKDLLAPAKCAERALETRVSHLAPTRRDNDSVLPHVLSLCAMANGSEPAACWVSFPSSIRHQKVENGVAVFPHVEVCRHARDTAPASCFQLWLRSSAFLLSHEAREALPSVIRVCQSLQVSMLTEFRICVKQGTRTIGAAAAYPLCQFVSPKDGLSNRRAIIECARTLARSRLPALAIATACAKSTANPLLVSEAKDTASNVPVRPESCMLAAQQSLGQWFDPTRFGNLCDQAQQGSTSPVVCASTLQQDATRQISQYGTTSSQRRSALSDFVVSMCRHADEQSPVESCLRLLPPKVLTAQQIVQVCSAGSMAAKTKSAAVISAQCVARALPILAMMMRQRQHQRVGATDEKDTGLLLVRLCEKAKSLAPSDCLASVQFDRRLSLSLAVSMCAGAQSDAPQRCLRRLQSYISSNRFTIEHIASLCAGNSSARAECAEIALREISTSISNASVLVSALCAHASSTAPAECLRKSPRSYSLTEKVALCRRAQSTDPAQCASKHLKRLSLNPQHQISLCRGALSQFPAHCALEAPYGMTAREIVLLCHGAESIVPATCARAVSTSLRLPPETAARVCSRAMSTLPGRCLNQEAMKFQRRSVPIPESVVQNCRAANAELSGLEILKVSYLCNQLRVNCPLSLTLRALDQFSDEMPDLSAGYIHVVAQYEGPLEDTMSDQQANRAPKQMTGWMAAASIAPGVEGLLGQLTVPIANGTASFLNLQFSSPGRFALTFRALRNGVEKVARIRIHPDLDGAALAHKCHALFFEQFQSPHLHDGTSEHKTMTLSSRFYLQAADCERYWSTNIAGLVSIPSVHRLSFSMPRAVFDFLLRTDVPRADMSDWERLGIAPGANRSTVRRAYHRRSLEWHPDKWRAVQLLPTWRRELDAVYALVTQAYVDLLGAGDESNA